MPPVAKGQEIDKELAGVLDAMMVGSEPISPASVFRRMTTISQIGTLSQNARRKAAITEAEAKRVAIIAPTIDVSVAPVLDDVEVSVLRTFSEVVRAGNFNRAAGPLKVDQHTVAKRVHRLERVIGVPLLLRNGADMVPTAAGLKLNSLLEATLPRLLAPFSQDVQEQTTACVTVGMPIEMAIHIGPVLIKKMREQNFDIEVVEGKDTDLAERVVFQTLDIALVRDTITPDSNIIADHILSENLGLVLHPRSTLADVVSPISLRQLTDVPLNIPSKLYGRKFVGAVRRNNIILRKLRVVESTLMAKALVRHDLGCAILPAMVVADELQRGSLVFRPLKEDGINTEWMLIRHCNGSRATSLVCADVAAQLSVLLKELASSGQWPHADIALAA